MPRYMKGAELILIGYNTPISALALDLNELCLRSGAYANLCFVVGVAKAATTGDELVVARIDLDQIAPVRKRWNFLGRRQPQHYGTMPKPVTEKEPHR